MQIITGTVHNGTIRIDAKSLLAGATVTVLSPEGDETFELSSEEESKLFATIAEAEQGETTNVADLLKQIHQS